MNTSKPRFFLILLLLALFNYFFWQEKPGINVVLFNSLLIASLVYFGQKRFDTLALKTSLSLTIITGIMLVVYNTDISFRAHFISFFILVGFLHRKQLSTVSGSLFQYGLNYMMTTFEPFKMISQTISSLSDRNTHLKRLHKTLSIILIPLLVFSVFVLIFKFANPVFGDILNNSFANLFQVLDSFFQLFSPVRLWFLAIGAFFIFSVLFSWERASNLHRISPKSDTVKPTENLDEAKVETEYKTALILICAVNALLLLINIIDIRYLWFNIGTDLKSAYELSKLVHEGTYLLILSIVLSIGILLYYFRKDLNFFKNNKWLVITAYVWIIQNGILVISVLLRNYEYIANYGLTHKRIGVAVFLLLTTIGLVMLWLKIKYLYSFFNLFRQAGWALYFVIACLTLFDWDSMIARYNLSTQNVQNLDYRYLYGLSERTLPILYENREKIAQRIKYLHSQSPEIESAQVNVLYSKIKWYLNDQQHYNWVSWDYSNSKAVSYLKDKSIQPSTSSVQNR